MPDVQVIADEINSAFGPGTVKLGSEVDVVTHWPTGILPIDVVLDGGLPVGRFTDVYGDFSTLKSYMALMATASVQRYGGRVAYVDTEHAFDQEWAGELGGDVEQIIVQRPETGEEAIGVMEALIRARFDLIVWDSVATTQPQQYAEKKPGEDNQVAGQARMMSAGLRRLNSVNKSTAVLAINQTRINVGVTYGSKVATPGGMAMPFYASYRMRLIKAGRESAEHLIWTGEKLEKAKQQTVQRIKVVLEKWKLNAPIRETWFDFDLRNGRVDEAGYMIGWLIENGYVQVGGNGTYTMDEVTIRGREKFFEAMAADEEVMGWTRDQLTKDHRLASPGGHVEPAKKKGGGRSKQS